MPKLVDIHVGNKVREARAIKGYTQNQLGLTIGVSFQQVQKYEKGTNRIGSSRLWEISQALDIPIMFFYDGLEGQSPEDQKKQFNTRRVLHAAEMLNGIKDYEVKDDIMRLIKSVSAAE